MTSSAHNLINGVWVPGDPEAGTVDVIDPRNGETVSSFAAASVSQVSEAVEAAAAAFPAWSTTSPAERLELLQRFVALIDEHAVALAEIMTQEIGVPEGFSQTVQVGRARDAVNGVIEELKQFDFEEIIGHSRVFKEAYGVVAAITPWNYPLYQVVAKIAPALGVGCTVVVKPAGQAPLSVAYLMNLLVEAGVPAGVANLVVGRGAAIGDALVSHPLIDMVSFTGSTEVGAHVAELASRDVKKVALELGGKSAGVLLEGGSIAQAAGQAVASSFLNSGQTCSAITRLIVPRSLQTEVEQAVRDQASRFVFEATADGHVVIGPVSSASQQRTVLEFIRSGVDEGARVLVGGTDDGRAGAYVQPTVFTDVSADMTIAQEEIFGPVLVIIPVGSAEEAIEVANGTPYGLSGAVWAKDNEAAIAAARRLQTGQVSINGGTFNARAPFGGVKKSGYGRELGRFGIEEYLSPKSLQLSSP